MKNRTTSFLTLGNQLISKQKNRCRKVDRTYKFGCKNYKLGNEISINIEVKYPQIRK
jgi:hypothetical protein